MAEVIIKWIHNNIGLTPATQTKIFLLLFISLILSRRGSEQKIWEDILKEFALKKDIQLAYPTQRFYNYRLEKQGN